MGCNFCDDCSDCSVGGGIRCDAYEGPSRSYDPWDDYDPGYDDSYSNPKPSDTSEQEAGVPAGQIGWADAKSHLGEQVTIFGRIAEVRYDKRYEEAMKRWRAYPEAGSPYKPMYLGMGEPWPSMNGISIVIWPRNRGRFGAPEESLPGKQVSITGKPYLYEGRVYIELSSPAQLEVHEQPQPKVQSWVLEAYDDEILF